MTYQFCESPNKSSRQGNSVLGLIAHFTAGGNFDDTVRYLCNRAKAPQGTTSGIVVVDGQKYYDAKAAAHYVTSRPEGPERKVRTVQLVKEEEAAWHAGSKTTTPALNGKKNVNLWSIGHEICNWGGLRKVGDRFYCWPGNWSYEYRGPTPVKIPKMYDFIKKDKSYTDKDGKAIFPDGVIEWWEPYQEETIQAVTALWKDVIARNSIAREWITGHETVDPARKTDPGPAFPWERILAAIYPTNIPVNVPTAVNLSGGDVINPSEVPSSDRSGRSALQNVLGCIFKR